MCLAPNRRLAARVDRGLGVSKTEARRLQVWKDRLIRNGAVIHYEPESERGFGPVHREAGVDLGLISVSRTADLHSRS
jgi:hypothetical protein